MTITIIGRSRGIAIAASAAFALSGAFWSTAWAQDVVDPATTPPDLSACEGYDCDDYPTQACGLGHQITLKKYTPAEATTSGYASYEYEVCSPPAGTCDGTVRFGESCLDDSFCQSKGQSTDPTASCSRVCAVDDFKALSHFDVAFPALGADSCITVDADNTSVVTGSCTDGNFVVGEDGSTQPACTADGQLVAKCDNTSLAPGECLTMTVNIAGETEGLGLGAAVVVDKSGNACTEVCMAGPSCERCDEQTDDDACLTRTIGFWGTHPWITNDYDPVTVCGAPLDCNDAADGKSDPACGFGQCNDIMEGLGSSPGQEGIKNSGGSSYVAMIKQLTAAKLNLNATAAAVAGGACADWVYESKTIQEWIGYCETLCSADSASISSSGCIEALDAFNNSEDVLETTPAPFDRPPVDDFGKVSGADSSSFTAAQGNNKKTKLVIGKYIGTKDCRVLP